MNRGRIAGIVTAVGLIGAGSIAYAAIPDPAGVVHGCYNKGGLLQDKGALRVVQSGEKCRSNELAMTWNQTGPQGPAGPKGDAGPKGEAGPVGPSTVYSQAPDTTQLPGGTKIKLAELSLPAGSYVLTGKAQIIDLNSFGIGVRCELNQGQDLTFFTLKESLDADDVTLETALVLAAPGTATLSCRAGAAASASNLRLSALRVGEIQTQ